MGVKFFQPQGILKEIEDTLETFTIVHPAISPSVLMCPIDNRLDTFHFSADFSYFPDTSKKIWFSRQLNTDLGAVIVSVIMIAHILEYRYESLDRLFG